MQKQDEFKRPIFTYQARLNLDAAQAAKLDAYATIFGRAQRSLFAAMQKGKPINDLKRAFLPKFGITARQFNALRVGLEGKIESIKARRPELILELQTRIKKAKKVVARLGLRPSQAEKLHQKKAPSARPGNKAFEDARGRQSRPSAPVLWIQKAFQRTV